MREITLAEQKQMMLEMMKDFDAFCNAHGLRYFLTGGSMLGAVRHKGFIPWDDDIDVGLPRKDYEKLIRIYNEERTNPDYELISILQNEDLYIPFAKIIHNKTVMQEAVDSDIKIGVFLDVFPLDFVGDTPEEARDLFKKTIALRRKIDVQKWKIIRERAWYRNVIIFIIKALSPKGRLKKLIWELDETCRKYEDKDYTKYCGFIVAANRGEKEILESEWFREFITVPFEDLAFRIPKDHAKILSKFYGDTYMTPPKDAAQKTHHSYKVYYKESAEGQDE